MQCNHVRCRFQRTSKCLTCRSRQTSRRATRTWPSKMAARPQRSQTSRKRTKNHAVQIRPASQRSHRNRTNCQYYRRNPVDTQIYLSLAYKCLKVIRHRDDAPRRSPWTFWRRDDTKTWRTNTCAASPISRAAAGRQPWRQRRATRTWRWSTWSRTTGPRDACLTGRAQARRIRTR